MKKGGAEGEEAEREEEEAAAPQGPTEIIKEIVTEDGTVMTIKEVIPGPEVEEEEEEEEEDGKITHTHAKLKERSSQYLCLSNFSFVLFLSSSGSATAPLIEPCPRSSAMATVRQGKLYLYGGMFEVGDRQFTLNDFYCLDLHKMDQWEVLVEMDPSESARQ